MLDQLRQHRQLRGDSQLLTVGDRETGDGAGFPIRIVMAKPRKRLISRPSVSIPVRMARLSASNGSIVIRAFRPARSRLQAATARPSTTTAGWSQPPPP